MASIQKNHGQYFIVYRDAPDPVTGKRKQVWEPVGKNVRNARLRLNQIEEMFEVGKTPSIENITFADAWKKRMAAVSLSKTTEPRTQNVYKNHLAPYFATTRVRTITSKQHITDFTIYLRDGGMSDGMLRTVKIELRTFLNWCHKNGYLPVKPQADWWDIPKGRARSRKPLTYKQVEALAEATGKGILVRKALVLWSAYVGTRLGETRAVKWEDFSDGMTEVWVRRAWKGKTCENWTKTDDTRHTPLMPRVREVMEELRAQQGFPTKGWVFVDDDGKVLDADNFRQRHFKPAKESLGLNEYDLHDLRHTGCSLMHKAGATPREIMQWLGWSELTTLLRYLHNYDEEPDMLNEMQRAWSERNGLDTEAAASDASDEWSCCL